MAKEQEFKLVRIHKNVGWKLVRHIYKLNQTSAKDIHAGTWLNQAVLEKIAREQKANPRKGETLLNMVDMED